MANLIVRNVDDEIVKALKERASKSGNNAEEEHRIIISHVLLQPKKRAFAETLTQMPKLGNDSDFERKQEIDKTDVFV